MISCPYTWHGYLINHPCNTGFSEGLLFLLHMFHENILFHSWRFLSFPLHLTDATGIINDPVSTGSLKVLFYFPFFPMLCISPSIEGQSAVSYDGYSNIGIFWCHEALSPWSRSLVGLWLKWCVKSSQNVLRETVLKSIQKHVSSAKHGHKYALWRDSRGSQKYMTIVCKKSL